MDVLSTFDIGEERKIGNLTPGCGPGGTRVTVAIAKNFNQLLELATEAMPDVDKLRWPDALDATPAAMGSGRSNVIFSELRPLRSIDGHLSEGFDPTARWGLA
jgi:hypothetical protein